MKHLLLLILLLTVSSCGQKVSTKDIQKDAALAGCRAGVAITVLETIMHGVDIFEYEVIRKKSQEECIRYLEPYFK